MTDTTPARPPARVSVSELLLSGLLSEHEILEDGTVNDIVRQSAEREYYILRPPIPAVRNGTERERPRSASARLRRSTSDERNQQNEQLKCCICFTADRTHLLTPCLHFCLCEKCSRRIHICPLCRRPVNDRLRIWM